MRMRSGVVTLLLRCGLCSELMLLLQGRRIVTRTAVRARVIRCRLVVLLVRCPAVVSRSISARL